MVTSSAPGKVYLFGEHAVVYGEPAIPCGIDRHATVSVDVRSDGEFHIHTADLSVSGLTIRYNDISDPSIDVTNTMIASAIEYVDEALQQAQDAADRPTTGFDVTIESDIPLGAGLGSSAAVVVACIDAATRALGIELSRQELAHRAYVVEYTVQDGQASRADTFCSTMGGIVKVEGDQCESLPVNPTLPFVIGYDGDSGSTGELVSRVRNLRDKYTFAAETVAAIGNIVRTGESLLTEDDLCSLGELMNFNHGLLAALGVSTRSLDSMVWAARNADAHGAKLTGAGGGGCIVALSDAETTLRALEQTPACVEVFQTNLDTVGVQQL